jgi:hypothetical protein
MTSTASISHALHGVEVTNTTSRAEGCTQLSRLANEYVDTSHQERKRRRISSFRAGAG